MYSSEAIDLVPHKGHNPIMPKDAKDHIVKVRLTEGEWREWQKAAEEECFSSVSEWLRHYAKKRVKGLDWATT